MTSTRQLSILLLFPSLLAGCGKWRAQPATAEECHQACEHVSAVNRHATEDRVREQTQEHVEAALRSQKEARAQIASIKQALAEVRPPFESTPEAKRKVPAETMRLLREQYRLAGEERLHQNEAALKAAEDQIAASEALRAKLPQTLAAAIAKAVAADASSCASDCEKSHRSTKAIACMTRAKAPDELPPCFDEGG